MSFVEVRKAAEFGFTGRIKRRRVSPAYWLGLLCTKSVLARVQRERWGHQAWAWAERYGGWSLATSWLPLIGDPIMLLGGVLRFHLGYIILLGLGTRVARYGLIIGLLGR